MKRRTFNMVLAMGLTLGLFVGAIAVAQAQDGTVGITFQLPGADVNNIDDFDDLQGATGAYFPWVPYGEELDGMGPFYGAVTVQNLEQGDDGDDGARDLFFFPGAGENDHAYGHPYIVANVQPNASVTVNAGSLGLPEPGGSVRVHSFPVGTQYDSATRTITVPAEYASSNSDFEFFDDPGEPFLGAVAGTVKNVSPMPSQSGKTSAAHITVDGYSGMTGDQVGQRALEGGANFHHILPIVQTNSGWNTMLRIASFAGENDPNPNVSYTVTLYESGGQGAAGPSSGTFTGQFKGGEVATIDILADPAIDEGWVGNAFITSNAPFGAVAERYKSETDMLLTNVSRPVESASNLQVAPLVFQNYNNWNSGISVANLEEYPLTVNIAYFTPGGSQVGADQVTIPQRGMEYVYTPASQDLSVDEFVGAAVMTASTGNIQVPARIHAAVDQVKYDGVGSEVGDAMSYVTDSERFWDNLMLALPLVQKGNPATGLGDTSGVQFFNSDPDGNIQFNVEFYDTTGNLVAPTLTTPISFNLSGHQGVTVYTHNYSEMPAGFQGSLVVSHDGGSGDLSAVSNNVNYAVQADGAAVFNLVNPDDTIWFWEFFGSDYLNDNDVF